jgi:uncharacterized protein involved in response to NO
MVPEIYHDFFLAVASASGALVGLLFVAVSLVPDRVTGPNPRLSHQVRASTALTALVTPLTLSLIALIPDTNIGWAAVAIGALGLLFVAATLRRIISAGQDSSRWSTLAVLSGFLIVMVLDLVSGIRLIRAEHTEGAIDTIAGAIVASLLIGVNRAWELVGGRHSGMTTSLRELFVADKPRSDD